MLRQLLLILCLSLAATAAASVAITPPEVVVEYVVNTSAPPQPVVAAIDAGGRRVTAWTAFLAGREHLFVSDGVRKVDVSADLAYPGATIAGPSIAFDGSTFLVAFTVNNPGPTLYTRRLGGDLEPIDAAPVQAGFDTLPRDAPPPTVAWNGSHFVLVWSDSVKTYAPGAPASTSLLVTASGTPGVNVSRLAGAVAGPHIGLLLVESRTLPPGCPFVFGCGSIPSENRARVLVLREDGIWANQGTLELERNVPVRSRAIGAAPSSFLASWKQRGALSAVAFSAAAPPVRQFIANVDALHGGTTGIAGDGNEWVIVWEDSANGVIDLHAAVLDADAKPIVAPFRLTDAGRSSPANDAVSPQVRRIGDRTYAITYVATNVVTPLLIGARMESITLTTNPPGRPRRLR